MRQSYDMIAVQQTKDKSTRSYFLLRFLPNTCSIGPLPVLNRANGRRKWRWCMQSGGVRAVMTDAVVLFTQTDQTLNQPETNYNTNDILKPTASLVLQVKFTTMKVWYACVCVCVCLCTAGTCLLCSSVPCVTCWQEHSSEMANVMNKNSEWSCRWLVMPERICCYLHINLCKTAKYTSSCLLIITVLLILLLTIQPRHWYIIVIITICN